MPANRPDSGQPSIVFFEFSKLPILLRLPHSHLYRCSTYRYGRTLGSSRQASLVDEYKIGNTTAGIKMAFSAKKNRAIRGVLIAGLLGFGGLASGQDTLDLNEAERMLDIEVVELRDQLVFGLRTFQPAQRQFIDLVIQKVESGEISRSMVNVVFVWARKRNPRVPYPYFEIVLRLLADRKGVVLPATNSVVIAQ